MATQRLDEEDWSVSVPTDRSVGQRMISFGKPLLLFQYTSDYSSAMATADGIQAFAESTTSKTLNELEERESDAMRQYLSKKTAWISPNEEQFDALVKSLKKRLDEGHGETILEIGTGGMDARTRLVQVHARVF